MCEFLEPTNVYFRKRHTSQIGMAFALQVSYFFSVFIILITGKFAMVLSADGRLQRAVWQLFEYAHQLEISIGKANRVLSLDWQWIEACVMSLPGIGWRNLMAVAGF